MKSTKSNNSNILIKAFPCSITLGLLAALSFAPQAQAAVLYFDGGDVDLTTGADGAATATNGNWRSGRTNWDNGTGYQAWTGTTDVASFASGTYTVSLRMNPQVGGIDVAGGAVTFDGNTVNGRPITLNSAAINVASGTATLGSGIGLTGTTGLTKTGAGTLEMSGLIVGAGSYDYSGGTFVNAGTLSIAGTGTLGTGDVTLADTAGVVLTLGNTVSFTDTAILYFGNASAINMNFSGDDVLAGITNTNTTASIGAGTYTAAQLNTFFGGSSFVGGVDATLTVIPEPSAALLGGLGLLALLRRRRA